MTMIVRGGGGLADYERILEELKTHNTLHGRPVDRWYAGGADGERHRSITVYYLPGTAVTPQAWAASRDGRGWSDADAEGWGFLIIP